MAAHIPIALILGYDSRELMGYSRSAVAKQVGNVDVTVIPIEDSLPSLVPVHVPGWPPACALEPSKR